MKKISFLYRMIRGAVGKQFVVKHYKGGRIVITKYPDMSGIVASTRQKERRELFREAVVYAKWIVADEGRKKAFRKTLPWKKRRHVYQAAIRLYMRMQGDEQWLRKQLAVKAMTRMFTEDVLVKSSNAVWLRVRGEKYIFLNQTLPPLPPLPPRPPSWAESGTSLTSLNSLTGVFLRE